jgi:hypothetical protein
MKMINKSNSNLIIQIGVYPYHLLSGKKTDHPKPFKTQKVPFLNMEKRPGKNVQIFSVNHHVLFSIKDLNSGGL